METYEAQVSKTLVEQIGTINSIELLKDKVWRQVPIGGREGDFFQSLFDEPNKLRLVFQKKKGCGYGDRQTT